MFLWYQVNIKDKCYSVNVTSFIRTVCSRVLQKFPAELHTNFAMNDNAAELPLLHRENKHGVDTTEKPYLLISHSCY